MSILLISDLAAEAGGYIISAVSILVVFAALAILVMIFSFIPKLIKTKTEDDKNEVKTMAATAGKNDVNVAIAMAIHLYMDELHDEESNVITIKNSPKRYSPWSSKIYGVLINPNKF